MSASEFGHDGINRAMMSGHESLTRQLLGAWCIVKACGVEPKLGAATGLRPAFGPGED